MMTTTIHKDRKTQSASGTVKRTFPVLGMTCASCANSAQTIVQHQEGVVDASVNFATGNLVVEYQSDRTNPEKLQKAVQGVGYDLLLVDESEQQETLDSMHAAKYQQLKTRTIWAIVLSVPIFMIGMFFMDVPYGNEI